MKLNKPGPPFKKIIQPTTKTTVLVSEFESGTFFFSSQLPDNQAANCKKINIFKKKTNFTSIQLLSEKACLILCL